MRIRVDFFILLILILTDPSGSAAQEACGHAASDSVAVHQVAEGIIEADNRRNLQAVMSHYAEGAVLYPPGEAPIRGRAAIRPRYETLFAGYEPEIVSEVSGIRVCGTLAVVTGHNGGWLRARGTRPDRTLQDVFVMVVEKADGAWTITSLMWHSEPSR